MRRALLAACLALSACPAPPVEKEPPTRLRTATLGDLPDPDAPTPDPLDGVAPAHGADATRDTLVLVVLGSARADHVGLCGGRARTPFLERLRDAHQATASCATYASTPWDGPALTDLLGGVASGLSATPAEPLPVTLRTRGYTSVLVNTRGADDAAAWNGVFDKVHVPPNRRAWKHPGLAGPLDAALATTDAKAPLLLVVVIADAEDPWPPVPRQRWGRNQDWMSLTRTDGTLDPRVVSLRDAELPLDVEDRFLRQLAVAYDHGLELADADTRVVVAALAKAGRDLSDMRLVVVGDHGTALGERGVVGNAPVTFDAAVRVPLVALDTGSPTAPVPAVLSTLAVRGWLLDGVWPAVAPPVAVARANRDGSGRVTMASTWSTPDAKVSWRDGKWEQTDLAADKTESSPTPPDPADPRVLTLTPLVPAGASD